MAKTYYGQYGAATAYAKRILNANKRAYAFAYIAWHRAGCHGDSPEYECSYMGAQAVRMNLHDLFWTVDLMAEYDSVAAYCAARGIKGENGDSLPIGISAACLAEINYDPEAFQDRVRLTAYARAMESITAGMAPARGV
jgi:hypothetical protein